MVAQFTAKMKNPEKNNLLFVTYVLFNKLTKVSHVIHMYKNLCFAILHGKIIFLSRKLW